MTIFETSLIIALLFLFFSLFFIIWPPAAPWFPSRRKTARRMLDLAAINPDELVYDLGSGDGRLIIMAARDYKARAVGIEIDPFRCLWTRIKISFYGLEDQVQVIWGSFFTQDISRADVVICYLLQKTNEKLERKLSTDLSNGTRIVSNTFTFPSWEAESHDEEEDLYLYRI